jgi:EAL domain-containing protein (putative c-di-GMP-specific phosphodiesterase class I)/GGDEF domain-containing protein
LETAAPERKNPHGIRIKITPENATGDEVMHIVTPASEKNESANAPHANLFAPHSAPADTYVPIFSRKKPAFIAPTSPSSGATIIGNSSHMQGGRFDYTPSFTDALNQAVAEAVVQKRQGALLIVSLTNLAIVVDAIGRDAAEDAVQQLIKNIAASMAPEDTVERLHRDQIGIILASASEPDAQQSASTIHRTVQNFGADDAHASLHLTCTIGSVDFPGSANTALDIIDKAYIALHSAPSGTTYRTYHDSKEAAAISRQQLGLANYLRRAIRDNKLRLAFQPVIEAKTGNVSHYEALLRVISEDGKISSAGPLIPVAEEMGLIDLIDHLVLDMVVQELEESPNVRIAFNVSNLTTENMLWLEQCRHMLRGRPEIATRITVEITETAAHRDLRQTAYFVASLQELGCQVALDDFGSGYTSFRQLKALSVDVVKIDGAFIKDIAENPDSRLFVKTLLEFTQAYGLESVAEFVENGEIAKILMELGVDYLQGYYFGKPQNFRSWLNPLQP